MFAVLAGAAIVKVLPVVYICLQVEHQKLKSFHFATDSDTDRAAWLDVLTHAATLQNDADDARSIC